LKFDKTDSKHVDVYTLLHEKLSAYDPKVFIDLQAGPPGTPEPITAITIFYTFESKNLRKDIWFAVSAWSKSNAEDIVEYIVKTIRKSHFDDKM